MSAVDVHFLCTHVVPLRDGGSEGKNANVNLSMMSRGK